MKHLHWLLFSLLAWGFGASAAAPPPASPPTAGSLQPTSPAEPLAEAVPALSVQQSAARARVPAADTDLRKFVIARLQLLGVQVFTPARLLAVSGWREGQAYSLVELRGIAERIERYYQSHGYPVAQTYVPEQDISDGAVTIAVSEGRYGQVLVRNPSHVSASILADGLQGIQSGDLVAAVPLERQLLLLSDLPGVQINSALVPGAVFGSSDLMVDVLPGRRVSGSVDADNAGNYYTGAVRLGATIFLNEPTGEGDVASLRLLTSGEGLNYFRGAYQLQIGHARVGAALSHLEYALGNAFENLLANGTASSVGVFGSYPLLRSRNNNLYGGASYESKRFEDRLDAVASVTEKAAHIFSISLSGDQNDRLGAGGQSSFVLTLSSGEIAIQTAAARAFDATSAQTNGHFNKLSYSASRLQTLNTSLALYAGINGQSASKNLDVSEKMQLGGLAAVRAYPEGEGFGDEGYVLNVEARWWLPRAWQPARGQLQLIGFFDMGYITLNKNPWGLESNQRRLSGTGLGLNWSAADSYLLRLAYAHKLGDEAASSAPDAQERLWLQGVKYF